MKNKKEFFSLLPWPRNSQESISNRHFLRMLSWSMAMGMLDWSSVSNDDDGSVWQQFYLFLNVRYCDGRSRAIVISLFFFQHEMIHAYLFVTDNNKVSKSDIHLFSYINNAPLLSILTLLMKVCWYFQDNFAFSFTRIMMDMGQNSINTCTA